MAALRSMAAGRVYPEFTVCAYENCPKNTPIAAQLGSAELPRLFSFDRLGSQPHASCRSADKRLAGAGSIG